MRWPLANAKCDMANSVCSPLQSSHQRVLSLGVIGTISKLIRQKSSLGAFHICSESSCAGRIYISLDSNYCPRADERLSIV